MSRLPNLHLSFVSAIYLWFLGSLVGGAVGLLALNLYEGHPYLRSLAALIVALIVSLLTFRTLKVKALKHQGESHGGH